METQKAEYKGRTLKYYTFGNEILLDTIDFCRIAELPTSAEEKDLDTPKIDLPTALRNAGAYDYEFADWLSIYFSKYNKARHKTY